MKRLFIFDFDGVLVDTVLDSVKGFNQVLSEFDKPTYSEDVTDFCHEDFWAFIKSNVYDFKDEFRMRFLEVYEESELENTHAYDGMIDVLKELQNQDKTFQSPPKFQLCLNAVTHSLSPWPLATAGVLHSFPFSIFLYELRVFGFFLYVWLF